MKECMKDLDETIEAILGTRKAGTAEDASQSYAVHVTGCIGNEGAAVMESWRTKSGTEDVCGERYGQADACIARADDGHAEDPGAMGKGLRFASFGRVEKKLFEPLSRGNVCDGAVDSSGIMDMKPFGFSKQRAPRKDRERSRTSISDLEDILGIGTVEIDKSSGHVFSFGDIEACTNAWPDAADSAELQPMASRHSALGAEQAGRWLRDAVGEGRSELNDLRDMDGKHHDMGRKAVSGTGHFGHRRAEGHLQQGWGIEKIERSVGRQQCAPRTCETQYSRDSLLFRNPMGSLDQLKSQVYYRIKKRRRLNSSTWSLGDSLSAVHPSRFSSLEFVSGCSMESPHIPGSASLPLILNTSGEMASEGVGVAQSFKKVAESIDFGNVTVFQLKQLMKDYGLSHAGKKNDLIDRIKSTLQEINSRLGGAKKEPSVAETPRRDKDGVYDNFFF